MPVGRLWGPQRQCQQPHDLARKRRPAVAKGSRHSPLSLPQQGTHRSSMAERAALESMIPRPRVSRASACALVNSCRRAPTSRSAGAKQTCRGGGQGGLVGSGAALRNAALSPKAGCMPPTLNGTNNPTKPHTQPSGEAN